MQVNAPVVIYLLLPTRSIDDFGTCVYVDDEALCRSFLVVSGNSLVCVF